MTVPGSFSGGTFALPAQLISSAEDVPVTYTLIVSSGSISTEMPLVVHPTSRFGAIDNTPITVIAGQPFTFAVQAEDDRGNFPHFSDPSN